MADFYNGYYKRFSYDTFNKLTEAFGLDPTKRINGFSKGMQRQAEMVLALSTHPKLLLLDESFDGIDPQKRIFMKGLLKEAIKENNMSVIISSHNLQELENLCQNWVFEYVGTRYKDLWLAIHCQNHKRIHQCVGVVGSIYHRSILRDLLSVGVADVAERKFERKINIEAQKPVPEAVVLNFFLSFSHN